MTFAAVVVVYNMFCGESSTCKALAGLDMPSLSVLIYDNSTKDMGNRAYCEQKGWTYLGGNGNMGISKAYNACVDHIKANSLAGYLCLFDDDTDISPAYFEALQSGIEAGGEIFAPLIYSAGKLLSPCRIDNGYRTSLFSDEEEAFAYAKEDITAINSGMAIALSVFDNYRYDENIFLDGVDHTFMRDMAARGKRLHLLHYRCDHAFSGDEKPPKKSALVRFSIYAKDHKYIFRAKPAYYWFLVGKRAASLTLQYKTLDFFKTLLKAK